MSSTADDEEDDGSPHEEDTAVSERLQQAIASSVSALSAAGVYNPLRHAAHIQLGLEMALKRLARAKRKESGGMEGATRSPLASKVAPAVSRGATGRAPKRSKQGSLKARGGGGAGSSATAAALQMVGSGNRRQSLQVFTGGDDRASGAAASGGAAPSASSAAAAAAAAAKKLTPSDLADASDMIHALTDMDFAEDDDQDFLQLQENSAPGSMGTGAAASRSAAAFEPSTNAEAGEADSRDADAGADLDESEDHDYAAWGRRPRTQLQKRKVLHEAMHQARQARPGMPPRRQPKPVAPRQPYVGGEQGRSKPANCASRRYRLRMAS